MGRGWISDYFQQVLLTLDADQKRGHALNLGNSVVCRAGATLTELTPLLNGCWSEAVENAFSYCNIGS